MIKFAIIGTNFITDSFIEATKNCEEFQLYAVYSRSIKRAKEYAEIHNAKFVFDNLEAMAMCGEIDAVYIASPNSCHAMQSILMMEHGKHVLCEKTIASNLKEWSRMKYTALKHQVVLLEAMRSVYDPGFEIIRENLHKLGKIRRVTFQYCQYSRRYNNYKNGIIENAFNPSLSNGALMDIGVYCVHPIVRLFGHPYEIKSSSLKLSNGVEASGTILLEYSDMQAELIYSKISNSRIPSQIQGELATMVIQEISDPNEITIYYNIDEKKETFHIQKRENNMYYEIIEFMRLIKEKQFKHSYLENSEMELKIMDEVRRQQKIIFPAD